MAEVLTKTGENDFKMGEGETSIWIEIDDLLLYIQRPQLCGGVGDGDREGVIVDVYDNRDDDAIATGAPLDTVTVYST